MVATKNEVRCLIAHGSLASLLPHAADFCRKLFTSLLSLVAARVQARSHDAQRNHLLRCTQRPMHPIVTSGRACSFGSDSSIQRVAVRDGSLALAGCHHQDLRRPPNRIARSFSCPACVFDPGLTTLVVPSS
jgi:hypothetical protein